MKSKKLMITIFILIITIFIQTNYIFASSNPPNITSQAAILIDTKTNQVLYGKNENERMYPASTTKIVTAIITLENCNLNDNVTVSDTAISNIPEGYSIAYLQFGEILTVEQLLELLLVESANDAANVLAEHVGGSIESFVSMMNTKVHDLGLENTHFTNPYGLHDENHYSTAYDLAMIMKYCIQNEHFRKLAGSASCAIPATNKYGVRKYDSTNQLILPVNNYYYQYVTTGKTGFTTPAGECLVSSAYKDNVELICVILGGQTHNGVSSRFVETKDLYEYGYNNYSLKNLVSKNDEIYQITVENATNETKYLSLLAENDVTVLLENDKSVSEFTPNISLNNDISAPIYAGDIIGTAEYDINSLKYVVNLVALHDVESTQFLNYIFYGIFTLMLIWIIICIFHLVRGNKPSNYKYK